VFANEINPRTLAFFARSFLLNWIAIKLLIDGAAESVGIKPIAGSIHAKISTDFNAAEKIVFTDLGKLPQDRSTADPEATSASSASPSRPR